MILVTGATGHIGNVLVRELAARGETVRALILPGEDTSMLDGLGVQQVEGDVLDPPSLRRAMQGVDLVFHLAGLISIMPGKDERVRRVNVEGTHNVLAAVRACGVRRLMHTSSIHAFHAAPGGDPIDERAPFDPLSCRGAYDRSKAEATLEVLAAARAGLDAVIVCPTGVIGPHDYRGSEMGAVVSFYARDLPPPGIPGGYDFVDVRDVARGMILAAERGRSGECYILSGERISVMDLIHTIGAIRGRRVWRIRMPFGVARFAAVFTPLYYRLTHTRPLLTRYALETLVSNSHISSDKARRELGYTTRPLRETLVDTLKWHKKY
jgi:dihydroflavonol-4-reductase